MLKRIGIKEWKTCGNLAYDYEEKLIDSAGIKE
jgi:hypothetical protein